MLKTVNARGASKLASPSYVAMKLRQFEKAKTVSMRRMAEADVAGNSVLGDRCWRWYADACDLTDALRHSQRIATVERLKALTANVDICPGIASKGLME